MDTIRVGIVGTGGISRAHQKAYQKAGGFEIAAVCDIFEDKALKAAEEWGVPKKNAFTDVEEMLEATDVDTVSVCTYNQAHKDPTVTALQAGKHVFCEKPMAATLEDATEMVRVARSSGRILQIGIHSTFGSDTQFARQLVDHGVLGDIYYAETAATRRRGIPGGTFIYQKTAGAGAVVDIGIYNMHNALYVMGYPKPVRVSATTADYIAHRDSRWDEMDVEEFGAAWIRFENGGVLLFKVSWAIHQNSLGGTYFLGKDAGLSLGGPVVYADSLTDQLQELAKTNDYGIKTEEAGKGWFGQEMLDITFTGLPGVDVWEAQMKAFGNAVRTGSPSPIPPEGVLLTNVIMDGIFRSQTCGEEVAVEVPVF
ncbi:oxidoreductase [Candidatus Poribacteria bacterium]|jgi:predicted dehydrogenase|nr:oxidoreductase [Candidatus Poribacteria bacterium]MDP6596612.1 Gfo/Idh/MocA family oxidoreductase [Candidatus Poribacteria bacterium]MDP6746498.1 Gfo/Idh/MocA family oxidoreductase [Candidatus Poribacteria bacterium]MDP6995914.1 Gfo/Idh/MocA family oxidoreductase [Candidatus Poribacteria bacterium]